MQLRHTNLTAQIVDFGRFLRSKKVNLNLERHAWALESAGENIDNEAFRLCLKIIFSNNSENYKAFDGHFDEYFSQYKKGVNAKDKTKEQKTEIPQKSKEADFQSLKNWLYGNQTENQEQLAAYGGQEMLIKKDFASYTDDDIADAQKLIKIWAKKYKTQLSRRKKIVENGRKLDLAASMKANFRRGTEIDQLIFSEKKPKNNKLLILADVSKSMELYSSFFIQIIYAFHTVFKKIDSYTFSYDIENISKKLAQSAFEGSLKSISNDIYFWGGNTKIAHCLDKLTVQGLHKICDKKTTVIILSDGLDADEPQKLADAMRGLKKQSKKVVWLNPLAGFEGYKPETEAMKAALPYIHSLSAGHNLESFRRFLERL